jgi:phosphoribosyl 1,2-cyclic phosphodiesterase/DNA-binding response OmpR family regulator
VRSDSGTLVVIDCGTGAYGLGQHLLARGGPLRGHILISHTHWDHIQGIPFFAPLFVAGNEWDIYGPKGLSESLQETLAGQMEHTYFPVGLDQFGATVRYHDLVEGTFAIGDVRVDTRYLNHPALTLGYRLEADGASMVYCCDHEPHSAALASGKGDITGSDRRYADFVSGADLAIHDAQYTASEYPAKVGWGHSSCEYALRIGMDAGIGKLVLTHHDPARTDEAMDGILEQIRTDARDAGSTLQVVAAAEGQAIELRGTAKPAVMPAQGHFHARTEVDADATSRPVLIYIADITLRQLLDEALKMDGIADRFVSSEAELLAALAQLKPSLVIAQHDPPGIDGIAIARLIRKSEPGDSVRTPVAIVSATERPAHPDSEVPTDWLVWPFSLSYARTRIRAWVLRSACRWIRAKIPATEERRLAALGELQILDTPAEHRFDRLTRMAATALNVPIALVSLVDRDRQWFKSCFGLDVRETSREVAFCAHVVHALADVVVPDALRDARFADNPLVVGGPRIRFYAGAPLLLDGGVCIGTFCIVDTRPRELDKAALDLLHDLRDLAVEEIRRGPAAVQ